MKTMRRSNFIVVANIVWFAFFAAEILAVLASGSPAGPPTCCCLTKCHRLAVRRG